MMFYLLYYMLENNNIDNTVFRDFFIKNSEKIVNHMVETLTYFISFEETYMVERDTLLVSIVIIKLIHYLFFIIHDKLISILEK